MSKPEQLVDDLTAFTVDRNLVAGNSGWMLQKA